MSTVINIDGLVSTTDTILEVLKKRLDDEFSKGRITGKEYANVYLSNVNAAISQSIQFELQKDISAAQAELIKQQRLNEITQNQINLAQVKLLEAQEANILDEINLRAIQKDIALVDLTIKSAELAQVQAQTGLIAKQIDSVSKDLLIKDSQLLQMEADLIKTENESQVVLNQAAKLVSDKLLVDANILTEAKQRDNLVKDLELKDSQLLQMAQDLIKSVSENELILSQKLKIEADVLLTNASKDTEVVRKENLEKDLELKASQLLQMAADLIKSQTENTVLQEQKLKTASEVALLDQKIATEKAQIVDTVNGLPVTGVIGKQKQLYTAQTDGFARDAEQKATKILLDANTTVFSINENPDYLTSSLTGLQLNPVLNKLKQGIGAV